MTDDAPRRRNTGLIVLLAIIGVLLLLCCIVAAVAGLAYSRTAFRRGPMSVLEVPCVGAVEATREIDRAIPVQGDVVLDISNQVGDVIIESAADGQVVVEALVRAYGSSRSEAERAADEVEVTVTQEAGGRIRVIGRYPNARWFQGRLPSVRFMIRVPRETTLQVANNVGRIEVSDIAGSAMIKSDVGDVVVREFSMVSDTRIELGVGRILVQLPGDSTFIVDAQTSVGDIDTDFDVRGAAERRTPPGDRLQGEVGDNPQIELRLRTNTGDISIRAD